MEEVKLSTAPETKTNLRGAVLSGVFQLNTFGERIICGDTVLSGHFFNNKELPLLGTRPNGQFIGDTFTSKNVHLPESPQEEREDQK